MVFTLGAAKFYGSSLPRPRIYRDVKFNDQRIDPPGGVTEPLMEWAKEAPWSSGGLSHKRKRFLGAIDGSVKRLRTLNDDKGQGCQEKVADFEKNPPKEAEAEEVLRRNQGSQKKAANLPRSVSEEVDEKNSEGGPLKCSESPKREGNGLDRRSPRLQLRMGNTGEALNQQTEVGGMDSIMVNISTVAKTATKKIAGREMVVFEYEFLPENAISWRSYLRQMNGGKAVSVKDTEEDKAVSVKDEEEAAPPATEEKFLRVTRSSPLPKVSSPRVSDVSTPVRRSSRLANA